MVLDDAGAAVDPVSAIDLQQRVDLADCGPVDVPADHTIQPARPCRTNHVLFKVEDELKSRLATFEQEWVDSTTPIQIHREGSLLDTARHLLEKYGPRIEKSL